jgi:hypothetical protein
MKLPNVKITAMIWPKPQAFSPGLMFERLRRAYGTHEYAFLFLDN